MSGCNRQSSAPSLRWDWRHEHDDRGLITAGLRPRPSATGKERINALDGLRAVAVLIIMGYHFGVGWLQGGFFSLDIFYVLSGYLITGLLVSEYRSAAPSSSRPFGCGGPGGSCPRSSWCWWP